MAGHPGLHPTGRQKTLHDILLVRVMRCDPLNTESHNQHGKNDKPTDNAQAKIPGFSQYLSDFARSLSWRYVNCCGYHLNPFNPA